MIPNIDDIRALATAADALPRCMDDSTVELREAPTGSDSPGAVRYYPAVYDKLSVDMGGWRERIAPGAFDDSLIEDDIRAMVDHDRSKVIARRAPDLGIDTLRITSDSFGVLFEIDELPNTTAARDLVENLRARNITGASFGFMTVEDRWDWEGTAEDGIYVRTVLTARMFEGSPVSFPAYPDTLAEARSVLADIVEKRAAGSTPERTTDTTPTTRSDERDDWLDIARLRLRAHEIAENTTPREEDRER